MSAEFTRRLRPLLILAAALTVLAMLAVWGYSVRSRLASAPPAIEIDYVGSAACQDCHADRHLSWARTFHRTMTQDVSAATVAGRFEGQTLTAFGGLVTPGSDGRRWWFDYADPATGQRLGQVNVARLVGSHRYQQYLTKAPDSETYWRLHYLWHIREQRWVHLNAAFLGSDAQSFDEPTAVWNGNCVNCHNTGAEPRLRNMAELKARAARGENVELRRDMRFDTRVAELGISCETCHGPGAEHLARMQRAGNRWWSQLAGFTDASIVEPSRLDAQRSNAVCGACHAGRVPRDPADVERIYQTGVSYRPGDVLEDHLTPLSRETPSPAPHQPALFALRFWADGSPRLTAYEYQGTRDSACSVSGQYTCIRCHTMHGGNPAAMLPDNGRDNDSCVRCHRALRETTAQTAHSRHGADSAGNQCQACHLPRAVYGVMEIHRTHRISVPDPLADQAIGKPNACLNCHQEQPAAWALAASQRLWPQHRFTSEATRIAPEAPPAAYADGLSALLAGDPVRQAIAADELGRVEQATSTAALMVRVPWLIEAMADDRPAVRRFSWRSLERIVAALERRAHPTGLAPLLAPFDYTGSPADRAAVVQALWQQWAQTDRSDWPEPDRVTGLDRDYRLDPAIREALHTIGAADNRQIDIGE